MRRVAAVIAIVAFGARTAAAAEPPRSESRGVRWDERWTRFRPVQYVTTAALFGGVIAAYTVLDRPPRGYGGVLFDDAARDAFVSQTPEGRSRANRISTYLYLGVTAFPFVDAIATAGVAHRNADLAFQLLLIDAQSYAVSSFLFRLTESLVLRARPSVGVCIEAGGSVEACRQAGTNGFFSGHAASSWTGAALVCTQHARLGLYGGGLADGGVCAAAVGVATSASLARLISDDHYATDVLVGTMVGIFAGWAVPSALHFGFDGRGVSSKATARVTPIPWASAGALGAGLVGVL